MTSPDPFDRVAKSRGIDPIKPTRNLWAVPDNAEPAVTEDPGTHRPERLAGICGQQKLVMRLGTHIGSAVKRGRAPGHVLFDGEPGLGKTTFARAIHGELVAAGVESKLYTVMPSALSDVRALAIQLSSLTPNACLFLDEIHGVSHTVQEALYTAMEDGHVVVKGDAGAETIPLPPFTLIGATTEPSKLLPALVRRFKLHGHLTPYDADDLSLMLLAHAEAAEIPLEFDAALAIGKASRGTPSNAIKLLGQVQAYSDEVNGDLAAKLDVETARQGMLYNGVDQHGLDERDQYVLDTLLRTFRGGPIGLAPLATTMGMDRNELTRVREPFLVRQGYLKLRGSGRCATADTYRVRDLPVPPMINAWK